MKKMILFLFVIPMMLLYPLTADAMKMSEPIYLGSIGTDQVEASDDIHGFSINGETANKGKRVLKFGEKLYKKGCATFGKDDLAVNVRYDRDSAYHYVGDKQGSNVIEISGGPIGRIDAVRTDSGIVFYYLEASFGQGGWFSIIGKLPDGRFVKYVASNNYHKLMEKEYARGFLYYNGIKAKNNMIIVNYFVDNLSGSYQKHGELRFPWDEKAQWFGVEKR